MGRHQNGRSSRCIKQSSAILVPFLDTLIARKIQEEGTGIILSVKGLFALELFSNLHSIFTNQYLHCVDNDRVLSCEVYAVAHCTAEKLIQSTLPTPNPDKIFNSLHLDQNNNVLVTLEDSLGPQTTHILNEKLPNTVPFKPSKIIFVKSKTVSLINSMIIS